LCDKNQVNKPEVFKLHVDDIWCNWRQSDGATAQLNVTDALALQHCVRSSCKRQ